MGIRPEAAAGLAGRRLGVEQIRLGIEAAEYPGPAIVHEFAIDISLVYPERAEQPSVLVARVPIHPYPSSNQLLSQGVAGLPAEGLVEFRTVDAHEPDLLRPVRLIDTGNGVAVVHEGHPPERSTLRIVQRAHWHRGNDRREDRGNEDIPSPHVPRHAGRRARDAKRSHGSGLMPLRIQTA